MKAINVICAVASGLLAIHPASEPTLMTAVGSVILLTSALLNAYVVGRQ